MSGTLCLGYLEATVPKTVVEKPSNDALALQSHLAVWVLGMNVST